MKKTEESLYFNIYKKITTDIRSKRLLSNTKLPSVRKAAAFYNVSCNTIQNAYNQLLDEGYIYSKEKKGYFVSTFDSHILTNHAPKFPPNKPAKAENAPPSSNTITLEANLTDTSFFPYATLRQLYREALSQKNNEMLERSGNFQGEASLRNAIATWLYAHRGVNCSPDQLLIGGGTSDLIQLIIRLFTLKAQKSSHNAFLQPVFFLEKPGFTTIKKIIEDSGCSTVEIPVTEEGADLNTLLEQSKKTEVKGNETCLLHLTPAHQFPTGVTMTAPRRNSILKWAQEKENRYIIEDDYDSDFRYKGIPIPALQGFDENQKVIYMGTFSRTLTPALRISYIILPHPLMELYKENFAYYKCPVPRIEQQVLADFIQGGYFERHINRAKKIYKSRRDLMLELLHKNFPAIQIQGEQAGLHFIAKIPQITEQEFIQKAQKQNILIKGTETGWLIIGYAHLSLEEIQKIFSKLSQKQ
ncbi:MAG: PLP-dependent aminotransferase family protein [Treponema sp.]|nr:PLP-dependent aminotransferase family protein [Treponema sp.]